MPHYHRPELRTKDLELHQAMNADKIKESSKAAVYDKKNLNLIEVLID